MDGCIQVEAREFRLGGNTMTDFDIRLNRHLKKCEIEFAARESKSGRCIPWLAGYCDNTEQICCFLRGLGFHIKTVAESTSSDDSAWVETTSGILVFVNSSRVKGLVAQNRGNRIGKAEAGSLL